MTAPSIDAVSGLVEELRRRATTHDPYLLLTRAADALEAQARELAAMTEVAEMNATSGSFWAQQLKAAQTRIAALEDAVRVKDEALT